MNRRVREALRQRNNEVDNLAAELIEKGWPPLEAFELAEKQVWSKRYNKSILPRESSRQFCPHGIDTAETDCGVCSQRT